MSVNTAHEQQLTKPKDEQDAMPVLMIRHQVADEGAAEFVDATEAAFAAVEAQRSEGIRYAYLRRAGRAEFIARLGLDEGVENPLPGL
ncbi:hypothetical protein ACFRQM_13875 [Streptomyces sp. NPDC056831]|uniref:hypothetical protein n=1 Tax=Streptomyces sp. NPDC056831 TaxID=3345954 RepID=UPI003687535D